MKNHIRNLSSRSIDVTFGVVYALTLLAAIFPPLYLASSGVRTSVLGMPFAISYWLIDAAVLGLALWAKYLIEDIRGELDEEIVPLTSRQEAGS